MRRGARDRGQAAVELALVLPLILTLVLALFQIAVLARDQVLVIHAAREAAREGAVNSSVGAIESAAAAASSALHPERLSVSSSGRGGPGSRIHVIIRYRSPIVVPLVGTILSGIVLQAETTMRVER